ncbi:hypothetical protein [Nitrosospira multiformis]|uniref:hypothetical protein n=1 Tax=Nitrosospira multiformis TaxID=1231 RepID=UPI000300D197|nr:hypothetical protein [Nitrosospira multiformis]
MRRIIEAFILVAVMSSEVTAYEAYPTWKTSGTVSDSYRKCSGSGRVQGAASGKLPTA